MKAIFATAVIYGSAIFLIVAAVIGIVELWKLSKIATLIGLTLVVYLSVNIWLDNREIDTRRANPFYRKHNG